MTTLLKDKKLINYIYDRIHQQRRVNLLGNYHNRETIEGNE